MFAKRIERLAGSLIREILQVAQRPEVISFAGGLPAPDIMPVMDFADALPELRQYGPTEGDPRLRSLIAEQLCALGRDCTPEQILITSGSQQGIDLVAKLFIDDGTPVMLEAPTYLAAIQAFRLFGARFVDLPLTPDGIEPAQLRSAIAPQRPGFVYLIPNFQNPSGYCYSTEKRQEIADAIDAADTVLVEDDPYRELIYDPRDRTPIVSLLKKSPWVYLGSFSKTACPGLRIGFLACSSELFAYFARLKQATDLHTNRLGQWWLANFIASPAYATHLQCLRDYYRTQRDAMQDALHRHFHSSADWQLPAGGLFFWLRLKQQIDTRRLLSQALDRNIAFMPGDAFFTNPATAPSCLRLNFSHVKPDKIEYGLSVLADVLQAL
ncbi:MAG: aminotransferase-like domain-containing protein [Gammaproteobacteria bacterium]